MSTPAKAVKAKTSKASKKPGTAAATIKITADTKITYKSPRPDGLKGPKTVLLGLVPKKGSIKFSELKAKAEAEGLDPAKIGQFMTTMAKNGRVTLA